MISLLRKIQLATLGGHLLCYVPLTTSTPTSKAHQSQMRLEGKVSFYLRNESDHI